MLKTYFFSVLTGLALLPGSYRFRLDSLLTALNKTQVPTGLLYDPTAGKAWLGG